MLAVKTNERRGGYVRNIHVNNVTLNKIQVRKVGDTPILTENVHGFIHQG